MSEVFSTQKVWTFFKDFFSINLGMAVYSFGWAVFLLPYHITTGGMAGLAAIMQYATGFPMQYSILIVNAILLALAWWQLGPKFAIKTAYAVFALSFYLELGQDMDVYDLAESCCLCELTGISIENGNAPVEVPDFTRGGWDKTAGFGYAF